MWRAESVARIILATGLLVLSNAFIEYATSGLENPLAYALVGLLMVLTLGVRTRCSAMVRRLDCWAHGCSAWQSAP